MPVNFDEVAEKYSRVARVQKSAGLRLIELLDIGRRDDVLDAGCGNGALTAVIRDITEGRVVGIDSSARMIEEARKRVRGVEFYVMKVEEMNFENEFDVVFSNSAFQWFDADRALERFRACLRDGGEGWSSGSCQKRILTDVSESDRCRQKVGNRGDFQALQMSLVLSGQRGGVHQAVREARL